MRRVAALAVLAVMLSAGAAAAAPAPGAVEQYKFDAKGVCHDSSGTVVKRSLCGVMPRRCRDTKTHQFHQCANPAGVVAH